MIEFIARAFALRLAVSALLLRSSNPFAPTKNEDDFGSSFYVCLTLQSRGPKGPLFVSCVHCRVRAPAIPAINKSGSPEKRWG